MNRGSLHTRSFKPIHLSVFRCRLSKNDLAGPKSFPGFREKSLRPLHQYSVSDLPLFRSSDRCLKASRRAFVYGFIGNNENVASSKIRHTQFKTRVQKPHPFREQNSKIDTLFMTKTAKNHTILGRKYLYQ